MFKGKVFRLLKAYCDKDSNVKEKVMKSWLHTACVVSSYCPEGTAVQFVLKRQYQRRVFLDKTSTEAVVV